MWPIMLVMMITNECYNNIILLIDDKAAADLTAAMLLSWRCWEQLPDIDDDDDDDDDDAYGDDGKQRKIDALCVLMWHIADYDWPKALFSRPAWPANLISRPTGIR